MNDSFGGGGFDLSQQNGGSGVQAEAKAEGIVPVLIKQIMQTDDTGMKLSAMSFGMVTIVGIVRKIEHSSTKITFKMEDITGRIDGVLWLEEGDTANTPALLENTYARAFGSIRNQGGDKVLMIFNIGALASINELNTHYLEVLDAKYMAEEFSKGGISTTDSANNNLNNGNQFAANNFTNYAESSHGLSGKQLLIYEAIKATTSSTGISLKELEKKFSHVSSSEVFNITEYLCSEGHIYTSIDSEHFLPTDA